MANHKNRGVLVDPSSNWIRSEQDYEAFARELQEIHKKVAANLGKEDLDHLKKVEKLGRLATFLGYLTAWTMPNLLSSYLISQGNTTRWVLMHHVGHRAYDLVPNVPKKYHSQYFAMKGRRWLQWFDWISPEAWKHEHNTLHHYHTGEVEDPDVVQNIAKAIRESKMPPLIKYAISLIFMSYWKLAYYAPNTLWHLKKSKGQLTPTKNQTLLKIRNSFEKQFYPGSSMLLPFSKDHFEFLLKCVLPYAAMRFLILPLLYSPLGPWAIGSVWVNSILAEIMANIHAFVIIVPNHAGDDLYSFEKPIKSKTEFYLRQIIGSTNYHGRPGWKNFLLSWLNYQIEHHLWPDLPLLKYEQLQPEVEALCKKYDIPYVKGSVWGRFKKMLDITAGKNRMRIFPGFREPAQANSHLKNPTKVERLKVQKKSKPLQNPSPKLPKKSLVAIS